MTRLNTGVSFLIVCTFLLPLPVSWTLGFVAEPHRISPIELKRLMDDGEDVVVVDVRSQLAYGHTHIRGAVSMPFSQIQARHSELPKNRLVAFY